MIRYAPKTPEGRAFDPIASALTAVAPIFKAAGAVKCQYEVEGIRGEYPVDGSFAATFAQDIRAKLGASEHFEINVDLVLPDGSEKIVVEVHNDLVCVPSAPSKIDGLTNGDFGEQALCYPEALDPAKSRSEYKVISTKSGTTAKGGRPYYAVVVGEVEAGRIICHGPWFRCFEEAYYFGTDDSSLEGNPIDVYTFDPNYKSKQNDNQAPEVVIVDDNGGKFFFTNPDFGSVPILFTQAAQFIDGRILAYIDYLKALQIVCFKVINISKDSTINKLSGVVVRDGDQANDVLAGAGISLLKTLFDNRDALFGSKKGRQVKMAVGFAEALGLPEKLMAFMVKHHYK